MIQLAGECGRGAAAAASSEELSTSAGNTATYSAVIVGFV